ncbi:caspase domain-containing protein [Streptomyces sp. NPDC005531]|uniref:caspase family protein n=1 Tax=Streptomyces sp. NPDC005531 TaxID=3364722 RepID=UPI0036CA3D03
MPDEHDPDRAGGRYLIAVANTRYPKAPHLDVPDLADARERVIQLFTEHLGYQHVSDLGLDPTKDQLTQQLRSFCRSKQRHPNDVVTVYVSGHGHVLEEGGEHVLLTTDTDPDDLYDALPTAALARTMLLGTSVRRLLLLLDTCYSGQGTNELATVALLRATRQWQSDVGTGFALVSSAQHDEEAEVGAFPHLLGEAVRGMSAVRGGGPILDLPSLVDAMNAHPDRPDFHRITLTQAGLTGVAPPFLPNPGYDPNVTPTSPLDRGPGLKGHYRQTITTGEYSVTTEFFLYSDTGVQYLLDRHGEAGAGTSRSAKSLQISAEQMPQNEGMR